MKMSTAVGLKVKASFKNDDLNRTYRIGTTKHNHVSSLDEKNRT